MSDITIKRPEVTGWQVHLGRVPVAVRSAEPAWTGQDGFLLHDLAGGLAYGFDAVRTVWEAAHSAQEIAGYRIRLLPVPSAQAMAAGEVTVNASVVEAELLISPEAFANIADTNIAAAQALMGECIRDIAQRGGMAGELAASIYKAWVDSDPTFALSIRQSPTTRPDLASPQEIDPAFSSETHREIARRVHAAGVSAGLYAGDTAKALDRDILAPAALGLLTERLARHAAEELIHIGMIEADRASADRERAARNLEQSSRLVLEWDPVARAVMAQSDHLILRRCVEVLVELALRDQPAGQVPVDTMAWMELLAAAQAYLEATTRSEAVHHQVEPTAINISDMFEIEAVDPPADTTASATAGGGRVYHLDTRAYQHARANEQMTGEGTPATERSGDPSTAMTDEPGRAHLPGVSAELDQAAEQALGISATDLVSVLVALAKWPLSPTDPDAVVTDTSTVIETLEDLLVFGSEPDGENRIRSAVNLLTSRPADLQAADWRPWHARSRQRRLLVQPIAALRDDFTVIAPHFCLTSASVYINHLTQGMLPWSAPQPPPALNTALAKMRDTRNRQLEEDVANALRAAGYTCRTRIREGDANRLGVPSLSGEIDILAGRPGSEIIWLLEVKDPADVYVVPEIRRHLDKFYVTHGKDKAYVDLLGAKHKDLAPHASAVASTLGLPVSGDLAYEIRPMFVTRRPMPAGFTGGPFAFTTIRELTQTLATREQRA